MPTIDSQAAASFGECLSGKAAYGSCPHPGYQTAETWLDGLMQSQMTMKLLTSAPCSMSQEEAGKVQPALNTLATYDVSSGSANKLFWNYVVELFAVRSTARKTAARDLAITSARLARENPNDAPEDIAANAELEVFLKALNGGY